MGYYFNEIIYVMGLNLLLIPVNLAGVLKSIQQALTGKQTPFCRTPKVLNRTAVPGIYVFKVCAIAGYSCWLFGVSLLHHNILLTGLNLFITMPLIFGLIFFLDIRHCYEDLRLSFNQFFSRDA